MDLQTANEIQEEGGYAALTNDLLNAQAIMNRVRSPQAGAIVLFAGKSHERTLAPINLT